MFCTFFKTVLRFFAGSTLSGFSVLLYVENLWFQCNSEKEMQKGVLVRAWTCFLQKSLPLLSREVTPVPWPVAFLRAHYLERCFNWEGPPKGCQDVSEETLIVRLRLLNAPSKLQLGDTLFGLGWPCTLARAQQPIGAWVREELGFWGASV